MAEASKSVRKTRKADRLRPETPNANAHRYSAQGAKVHQRICLFKLKLHRAYRDNLVEYHPFG